MFLKKSTSNVKIKYSLEVRKLLTNKLNIEWYVTMGIFYKLVYKVFN